MATVNKIKINKRASAIGAFYLACTRLQETSKRDGAQRVQDVVGKKLFYNKYKDGDGSKDSDTKKFYKNLWFYRSSVIIKLSVKELTDLTEKLNAAYAQTKKGKLFKK